MSVGKILAFVDDREREAKSRDGRSRGVPLEGSQS
jgi:hypothetical protein